MAGQVALPSLFMDRCWILVGMMGAGKSSVGRALAALSGREFVDTDLLLQARLGRPITQLFQIYGEAAFRDHENSILRSLNPSKSVLSTGGGIVTREANWTELRRLGTTIYLRSSVEAIIGRLETSKKKRPLLQVEEWPERVKKILAERESLYEQADIIVDLEGHDVESAARRVLESIERAAQP